MTKLITGRHNTVFMLNQSVKLNDIMRVDFIPTPHIIADLTIHPRQGDDVDVIMLMIINEKAVNQGDETKNDFCLIDKQLYKDKCPLEEGKLDRNVNISDVLMVLNQVDGMNVQPENVLMESKSTSKLGVYIDLMKFMNKGRRP